MPTSDEELQPYVAASYLTLADVLASLPEPDWDTPSLCEGWRIREVVAHMTMPARYSEEDFMAELRECEFDFTRLSNLVASRDAVLPVGDLVGNLRDDVMKHWTPQGGGFHGALNHVVIHSLDVTVPLGQPRSSADEAIRIVLDDLTQGGGHAHFGTDISGKTYRATDIQWSFGSGPVVSSAAQALAAHFCGRSVPM